jgi:hypothetical protein
MRVLVNFLSLLATLAISGCAAGTSLPSASLKTPRSMADLLLNVREATRNGLILEQAFFTEQNLTHVFAGAVASITQTPGLQGGGGSRDRAPAAIRLASSAARQPGRSSQYSS